MKAKEFIFWTICLAVAVVCSFWVIRTYTAKSVINGGAQEVSDNLVFIMQSPTIVMAKDSKDSNHYFAEREFSSVYQVDKTFDAEKFDYEFSLNGRHFASSVFEYGEFICTLDITFVGTNNKDLITDVLSISIKFYSQLANRLISLFTLK